MNSKRNNKARIASRQSFFSLRAYLLRGLILTEIVAVCSVSHAQDLRFTQVHASETFLNPAFAGSSADPRFILNFRDQWPNLDQAYVSYRFSYDGYINALSSGLGAFAYQDNQGNNVLKATTFGGQYMYQARFSDALALNIGLQFAFTQVSLDWQQLQFYDQIDLLYGFNDVFGNPNPSSEPLPAQNQAGYFDLGAGALIVGSHFYVGLSAGHLTQPTLSFYSNEGSTVPLTISGQGGLILRGQSNRNPLIFNPLLVYSNQRGFEQLETGFYLRKSILLGGLFFKHNTAGISDVSLCAGISKGFFSFAYSYDITVGELSGATGGAHEVSMIFTLPENKSHVTKRNQKNMLGCPRVL